MCNMLRDFYLLFSSYSHDVVLNRKKSNSIGKKKEGLDRKDRNFKKSENS